MQSFQMRTGWYRLSLDILVVQDRIASWSANSTMDGVWESEPCSLLQFDVAAHFRSPAQVQKILLEHCLPGTSISTQIIAIASLLFPPPSQLHRSSQSKHGIFIQSVVFRTQVLLLLPPCEVWGHSHVVLDVASFRRREFLALV